MPVAGTSIFRARVAALPPGDVALPAVPEGSGAWSKMVPIAYQSFGSGPDLLLIAGQDGTLSWWDPALLSDLSSHYTVTVFDLPGAGYSGPVDEPTFAPVAGGHDRRARPHPRAVRSRSCSAGASAGEIALSLAERHPGDRVLARPRRHLGRRCRCVGVPHRQVVRLLATPGATPLELSRLLFPPTTAGLQERVQWQNDLFSGTPDWLTAPTIKAEAALQAAIWKRSTMLQGYLTRVTIPALVVSGADDVVFPPANANELAVELPPRVVGHLPGAGYGAITQDEPAFVAAVEKFTG